MARYQGIIIAGFGGQGILSIGKILAEAGMAEGMNVSWLPSYGPEMRGGTAYCHVILSDDPIGSPLLNSATSLIALNKPSFEKFTNVVVDGGVVIVDGSLVEGDSAGENRRFFSLPATKVAVDQGNSSFANIILAGKLIEQTKIISKESFEAALNEVLSEKYKHLIPKEMEMLQYGMDY